MTYVGKMFSLLFNMILDHLLLGWISNSLVQITSSLVYVVDTAGAYRLQEREDLLAVLDALLRVYVGHMPTLCVVRLEEGFASPALLYCGNLVCKIVHICNATVETKTPSRRE